MLSRTAESLFWAARYIERAETTARLLEVGYRMSMILSQGGQHGNEWESLLAASGTGAQFHAQYGTVNQRNVADFLIYGETNPSSIKNCIKRARENARVARTGLTSDVWETLNQSYLRFQQFHEYSRDEIGLPELCDWTKRQSAALRGAVENTQLRDEGFDFFNLGYYIERADNTARLLDVKYYVLLPTIDMVGGSTDQYQWSTLLRAMSAHRAFHWMYQGDYTPEKIADFLILNGKFPRSLLHCCEKASDHLTRISKEHGQDTQANFEAATLMAALSDASVEQIIGDGLHEFLSWFIERNSKLSSEISSTYMFGQV